MALDTPPALAQEAPTLYCANHPETETLLRCNKCNKPICLKCAVQTPVGYRCRECVREQQDVYYNASNTDNLVAFGVAFVVVAIATPIIGYFGAFLSRMWFIGLIIAFTAGGAAGTALAQIVRRAVNRRRSRAMRWYALAGILLGLLVGSFGLFLFTGIFPILLLPVLVFVALAIASALPFLR